MNLNPKQRGQAMVEEMTQDFLDRTGGKKYHVLVPLRMDIDHDPVTTPDVLYWRSFQPHETLERLTVIAVWVGEELWVGRQRGTSNDRCAPFDVTLNQMLDNVYRLGVKMGVPMRVFDEDVRADNLDKLYQQALVRATKGI